MNVVMVSGRLSRAPAERVLPSGDRLVALEVTVPGEDATAGRAESVPVAWPNAPSWTLGLEAGAEVVVLGRVRRRFFRAGAATQSRTEVVAERVALAGRRQTVGTLLDRAGRALAEFREAAGRPGQTGSGVRRR